MKAITSFILILALASTAFAQPAKAKKTDKKDPKKELPPPPTLTYFGVSFNPNGTTCTITVDSRESRVAHADMRAAKGEVLDVPVLGAEVRRDDQSDGFNIVYDFSTFKDLSKLKSLTMPPVLAKEYDDRFTIDADEQALVLNPFLASIPKVKRVYWPFPRPSVGPMECEFCINGMHEGEFTVMFYTLRDSGTKERGIYEYLAVSFQASDVVKSPAGTVVLRQQKGEKGAWVTHLKEVHPAHTRKEYEAEIVPIPLNEHYLVDIAYAGELPIAIPRFQVRGNFPPQFGASFAKRGSRVFVETILAGSTSDVAGLKVGDVLQKLNGKVVQDALEVIKALDDTEYGKENFFEVERFSKKKIIRIYPY